MLFSDYFGITKTPEDDWFDPILLTDSPLFIDPFLLFDNESGIFSGSHDEIIQFFDHIFKLIAQSGGNQESHVWEDATSLLALSEVSELCLGYSLGGTDGSGSGKGLATQISRGILAAIQQKVLRLNHFEEVQIFQEGIGPDRISDATAGIIRHRIAKYTEDVAKRHNLDTRSSRHFKSKFDFTKERWLAENFNLPVNPYNNESILLIPKDYLRPLPTINPDDFWGYCYDTEIEVLRRKFGEEITRHVDKEMIVEFARENPSLREKYVRSKEVEGGESYDLRADPIGFYQPYIDALGWAETNPVTLKINSNSDIFESIKEFVRQFKLYVEQNGGWRLLWNDNGSSKKEIAFQALFLGIMVSYCKSNNIDVSKEPNIGRGPVDFKFSRGYANRVLIEAKLASSTKFSSGIKKQLPTYLHAEQIDKGIFLVCCQRDKDFERLSNIRKIAREVSEEAAVEILVVDVDCRAEPPSASLL